MPNISWKEISDLRHILWDAEIKLAKKGLMEHSRYIQGIIKMIDEIIEGCENGQE